MNKRELSKVFSKLSREEVNLESHKVELGLMQDALQIFKKAQDEFTSAASMEDRAKEEYKNRLKKFSQAKKISDKVKESSKNLGVDLPSSTQKLFDKIDFFVKESQQKSR